MDLDKPSFWNQTTLDPRIILTSVSSLNPIKSLTEVLNPVEEGALLLQNRKLQNILSLTLTLTCVRFPADIEKLEKPSPFLYSILAP